MLRRQLAAAKQQYSGQHSGRSVAELRSRRSSYEEVLAAELA
eukprot:SAG31_NODE_33872_length_339_cov_0.804167_2_plen_41_part_01